MENSLQQARPSIDVYMVMENEKRRQERIEQGMAHEEIRTECESNESNQTQSPRPLFEPDVESLYPLMSLQLHTRTPQERFCVVDLVDDCDAIYGRILWANEDHNPNEVRNRNEINNEVSPLHQRQRHANQLAMRFLQNTGWNDWQHMQSSGAACNSRVFSLPELDTSAENNEFEESGESEINPVVTMSNA